MAYESLIGNWSDGNQFYGMRKKYMLQRVDDAYNDRNINSKIDSSTTEYKSKVDLEKLKDDTPKTGKAVSLLRDSSQVSDDLIDAINSVAMTDHTDAVTGAGALWNSIGVSHKNDSKGLSSVRSILGRSAGTSPTYQEYDVTEKNLIGGTPENPQTFKQRVYDFSLTAAEKANLKSQSVQSLLDKFFEVDTSKY